jgi:hypothetical protein
MILSPIVNTDIKMPAKMLDALGLHETICMVTGVHEVTEQSVVEFLVERYGDKFAANFKPEYLFNSPNA